MQNDQTSEIDRNSSGAASECAASERLGAQAAAVVQDVKGIGSLAKDVAHEKLEEMQVNASAVFARGKDQIQGSIRTIERHIVEKPLTSVAIAVGLGLFLGRFWMRR